MVGTHYFLVGAGLPCRQLEVLPSQDEEQEEGQHEELPVPHRHQEDLRRQRNKISNGLKHSLDLVKSLADGYRIFCSRCFEKSQTFTTTFNILESLLCTAVTPCWLSVSVQNRKYDMDRQGMLSSN